ncbi:MAG TPA: hypothetical protein VF092_22925 [Longimicrobium sp.]
MRRVGADDGFQIELRITDRLTPVQQEVVVGAAERWVKLVRGPAGMVQEVGGTKVRGLLVHVTASFGKHGGVVASTQSVRKWPVGPLAGLPRVVKIEFDTAELDELQEDGRLGDVAVHELAHALGFGVVWRDRKLVEKDAAGQLVFRGTMAMQEYARLRGAVSPVPVPIDEGIGKSDDHWQEKTFAPESMTPTVHKASRPLSRITVSSLGDLGYAVSLDAADPFKLAPPVK